MRVNPFFEVFEERRLFCVLHEPEAGAGSVVLYVPPFAEEANRTRHLASRQARDFAALGVATFLVDLSGTGDSTGDFADATWRQWCSELRSARTWLAERGYAEVIVWGARLGCALALDAGLFEHSHLGIFWQPYLAPKAQLRHYLRLKVAGQMASGDRLSVGQLEARLAEVGYLDVGGYRISQALAEAMRASQAREPAVLPERLAWFEVAPGQHEHLPSASQAIFEDWRARGVNITARPVDGDQFWAIQTLGFAPALIEATTQWLTTVPLSDTNAR